MTFHNFVIRKDVIFNKLAIRLKLNSSSAQSTFNGDSKLALGFPILHFTYVFLFDKLVTSSKSKVLEPTSLLENQREDISILSFTEYITITSCEALLAIYSSLLMFNSCNIVFNNPIPFSNSEDDLTPPSASFRKNLVFQSSQWSTKQKTKQKFDYDMINRRKVSTIITNSFILTNSSHYKVA